MKQLFRRVVSFHHHCYAVASRAYFSNLTFVPYHESVHESQLEQLQELVDTSTSILVLSGAGVSTESGIPDYRSEGVGLYARTNHRPIQHQDFMKSPSMRQRYWARNFVGWPNFSSVQPNASHMALVAWERLGKITGIVTQNVDRLHTFAGSKAVIELHGTAHVVKCMKCDERIPRKKFQETLIRLNPDFLVEHIEMRPDADVALPQEMVEKFKVPLCEHCRDPEQGFYKPDIVFFGDNVPKERVDQVYSWLETSDCLLILGSSLHVYSGYRFILRANELGKPIAIVNIGATRGDKFAQIKLSGKCSDVLSKICI